MSKYYITELIAFATGTGGYKILDMYLNYRKNSRSMDVEKKTARTNEFQTLIDLYKALYQEVKESEETCQKQYNELRVEFVRLENKHERLEEKLNQIQNG